MLYFLSFAQMDEMVITVVARDNGSPNQRFSEEKDVIIKLTNNPNELPPTFQTVNQIPIDDLPELIVPENAEKGVYTLKYEGETLDLSAVSSSGSTMWYAIQDSLAPDLTIDLPFEPVIQENENGQNTLQIRVRRTLSITETGIDYYVLLLQSSVSMIEF